VNAANEKLKKAQADAAARLKDRETALKQKFEADRTNLQQQKERDVAKLRKQVGAAAACNAYCHV